MTRRPGRTPIATATTVVLATAGGLLTTAATPASAAGCTSPTYTRQFFANTTFSGTPKRTDCDAGVDEYWSGSPATGVPADNFSVRWTVTRDFGSGGPFSLAVRGQDGMRVYLDGYRKIDLWKGTSTTVSKTVNLNLPAGKHTLRVDYVNWSGVAAVKFGYAPITSATYDKVKPLAPTGAAVAYDAATSKAKLTWARNREMDLAGYRVYVRVQGTSTWRLVSPLLTTTTFTHYLAPTGTGYAYEVRAVDKAGNESAGSADQYVTTVDRTAPAAPAGVSALRAPGAVQVRWQAVAGAASYRVERAAAAAGPFNVLASGLTGPSYDDRSSDAGRQRWYYRVLARDAAGNTSAPSAVADAGEPDLTGPVAVTGLTALGTTAGNALAWQASSSTDVHHYEVWGAPTGQQDPDGPQPVFGTSYTDPVADAGVPFTYTVVAVDAFGNASPAAPTVAVTRPVPSAVPAPAGLQGTPADAFTTLAWTVPDGTGVTGFRVYRRTDPNGAWTPAGSADASATSYQDTSAPKGTAYYYVVAVDGTGAESVPSGPLTVDRLTPATATGPAAPRAKLVSSGGTRYPVQVGLAPAVEDAGRLLKGYSWTIDGACGSSGTRLTTTDLIEWIPQYTGPCMVTVHAVDAYGRVGEQGTSLEFMVQR
ncbi:MULTISPECIES: PA14 domain-containing protein [Streptomyces]|uniref:Cellulose 1,4-beta-cellobiosidase n=2 Tax=Streptomyces TaxID=1883 RepID=A0A2U9P3Y8_STRAS|nr:PA14 domain-containing protein [Streptomyces actuosus]AWT44489.1 cellulose 1,4-beta-cellobiosidase [Streptomyces actuosus]MBM4820318.1 cellulose 1,4-beta-cellobiosidase [Streptomyces actuosus]